MKEIITAITWDNCHTSWRPGFSHGPGRLNSLNHQKNMEPNTSPKFYKKELVSNRLALPNGKVVKFEQVGDSDTGVLATTDQALASELDKAAAAGRGGVVEITAEQFENLKKNPPAGRSRTRSFDAQSVRRLLSSQKPVDVSAAAVPVKQEPSAPMEVPKGLATISSRRKLQEMKEKQSAVPDARTN